MVLATTAGVGTDDTHLGVVAVQVVNEKMSDTGLQVRIARVRRRLR